MPDDRDLWLPLEDRLALFDAAAAQVRVVGWRPGPAGVSTLELPNGLQVLLDHASPTTLNELAIPVGADQSIDSSVLDLVSDLLGDEATDAISSLPSQPPSDRPRPLPSHHRRDEFEDLRRLPLDERRHQRFAHLVLGADLGEDASLSDLARGVALVEASLAAVEVHPPSATDLARRGLALVASSADAVAPSPTKRATRVEALVQAAAEQTGLRQEADAALEHLRRGPWTAERVRRYGPAPAVAPMAPSVAPAAAAGAAAGPMRVVRDLAAKASAAREERSTPGRPVEVDGEVRGWAWLDDGSNVHITAGASAADRWARVFRRDDRLLLGLAPMRTGDDDDDGRGQLEALVVVPPVDGPGELVVDLVLDPSQPRRSPVHDQVRAAVLAGRHAARYTRLGAGAAERYAWEDCAQRWEAVGDPQRANLARRNGQRDATVSARGRRGPIGPLVADELDG